MFDDVNWSRLEISFVAAVPRQLLREAKESGIEAHELLNFLVGETEILFHHTEESPTCLLRMGNWLEARMERLQCWSLSKLIFEADEARGDPHVMHCSLCQSKRGWIKSQLAFLSEYVYLTPEEEAKS